MKGFLPDQTAFSATQAIYSHDHAGDAQVLLSDDPGACQRLTQTQLLGRSRVRGLDGGIVPSIFLVLKRSSILGNDVRTVGDDLKADLDPGQPGSGGLFESCVKQDDGGGTPTFPDGGQKCRDLVPAESGQGHLFRNDDPHSQGARASGDVTLAFGGGATFVGGFSAQPCEKVTGGLDCSCGSIDGLGLAPLLAVLVARRRRRPSGRESRGYDAARASL